MENKEKVKIFRLDLKGELSHGICVSNLAAAVARELALP